MKILFSQIELIYPQSSPDVQVELQEKGRNGWRNARRSKDGKGWISRCRFIRFTVRQVTPGIPGK